MRRGINGIVLENDAAIGTSHKLLIKEVFCRCSKWPVLLTCWIYHRRQSSRSRHRNASQRLSFVSIQPRFLSDLGGPGQISRALRRDVRKHTKTRALQHARLCHGILVKHSIVVQALYISTALSNAGHLSQLFKIACYKIQERQLVKVFGFLIRTLHDVMGA